MYRVIKCEHDGTARSFGFMYTPESKHMRANDCLHPRYDIHFGACKMICNDQRMRVDTHEQLALTSSRAMLVAGQVHGIQLLTNNLLLQTSARANVYTHSP